MTSDANPGAQAYVPRPSIGGSDIGTLLGVNRYGDPAQVYERIATILDGRPVPASLDNPDMERGRELEAACVRKYERETGYSTVHFGPAVTHPTHPYMHANPDRLIIGRRTAEQFIAMPSAKKESGILEAKCPRLPVFKATREVGVNPSYYAQLQHYLAVTDLTWGSFAFLNAEDWELHTIDIARDEEMIAQIFDVCEHFWAMVQSGTFNAATLHSHTLAIAEETKARAQLTAGSVVRDTHAWRNAMTTVKAKRESFALAKAEKEMAEEVLKSLVEQEGVTEIVIPGLGKVTYKEQDRTGFDLDAFLADHPDLDVERYRTRTVYSVLRPTFGRR